MRFDKFTIKSQEALSEAQSIATAKSHGEILPSHLLLALLAQPEGSTRPVLQKIGILIEALRQELEETLEQLPRVSGGGQPQLSRSTSRALEGAFSEAEALRDDYVSTEHLLLALCVETGDPAGRALAKAGVTREALLQALATVRGSARVTDADPES
ncbi:MAG: Clp protease N-terminal domain-containing protein, partial [Myxococcota bacterium]